MIQMLLMMDLENHIIAILVTKPVVHAMEPFYISQRLQIVKNVIIKMVIIILLMRKELVLVMKLKKNGNKNMALYI
jgi:hypothetical protein